MKKSLLDKLAKFWTEKRKSTGGWAEVRTEDMRQLADIIYELIERKWERDPDGDLPIEVQIVDRTRFERTAYAPVPYMRDGLDMRAKRAVLDSHVFNLELAYDRFRGAYRALRDEQRREEPVHGNGACEAEESTKETLHHASRTRSTSRARRS